MSLYRVQLVEQAEQDLAELVQFIAGHDSPQAAGHMLEKMLQVCESLELHPERGRLVPELQPLGIKTYREVHFGPYRVVYEILGRTVFVLLIVDGRRSLQSVLERRLLR